MDDITKANAVFIMGVILMIFGSVVGFVSVNHIKDIEQQCNTHYEQQFEERKEMYPAFARRFEGKNLTPWVLEEE